MNKNLVGLSLGVLALLVSGVTLAEVDVYALQNKTVQMTVTPDIGGRVLSFQLTEQENFLKVSDKVTRQPKPEVSAHAENISYFGHEMWLGPQSAWWTQQTVNKERRAAKAIWPADPYLMLGVNKVLEKSGQHLVMQSPPSPVSGVQMRKSYRLLEQQNTVELAVETKNIRTEPVSWDIWFNTRVHADTQVYVPVASEKDIRVDNVKGDNFAPISYSLTDRIFSLDLLPLPAGKTSRHGKVFIQPEAGWMAGFNAGQLFIIHFPLLPVDAIHPEQGQVELYHHYNPDALVESLLEMELHAAYSTLAPGATMDAVERWSIFPYSGPDTRAAQLTFLREKLQQLKLVK